MASNLIQSVRSCSTQATGPSKLGGGADSARLVSSCLVLSQHVSCAVNKYKYVQRGKLSFSNLRPVEDYGARVSLWGSYQVKFSKQAMRYFVRAAFFLYDRLPPAEQHGVGI